MISDHLAEALRDAGLRWRPAPGDRFVIPQPELAGQLFTLSEMTIEAREYPTGTVLGFNGTTEWALDSVELEQTLWMPREDQLREMLGGTFVALAAHDVVPPGAVEQPADPSGPTAGRVRRWTVRTRLPDGREHAHVGTSPADAYALALLDLIGHAGSPVV